MGDVSADLYANDTILYDIQNSLEIIEQNLQFVLNLLHFWCKSNGMLINSKKSEVMLVTTNQKRQRLNSASLQLHYIDVSLNMTSSDKILGVFLDINLMWSDHVKHITKKILSNTRVLQNVLSLGSDYFSATFYQTYFYYKPSKHSPFTETHFCILFT